MKRSAWSMVRIWPGAIMLRRADSRCVEITRSWSHRAWEVWRSPLGFRLDLDVAAKPVEGLRDRHDPTSWSGLLFRMSTRPPPPAGGGGRFMADRLAEVDVVDLASPDHSNVSHSWRSAKYRAQRCGSLRSRW